VVVVVVVVVGVGAGIVSRARRPGAGELRALSLAVEDPDALQVALAAN
jgi:hypothetical protein